MLVSILRVAWQRIGVELSAVPYHTDPEASAAGINHAVLDRKSGPGHVHNRVENSKLSFSSVGRRHEHPLDGVGIDPSISFGRGSSPITS